MSRLHCVACVLAALVSFAACLGGCENRQYRDQVYTDPNLGSSGGAPDAAAAPDRGPPKRLAGGVECEPAVAADHLPPRGNVMTRTTSSAAAGMLTDDLFEQFSAHCQGCHVDTNLGGFQVKRATFKENVTRAALERIRSDDLETVMPPPPVGEPFSLRPQGHPLREFARLLEAWLNAGSPNDVFYPDSEAGSAGNAYFLSREIGMQMTNLGNCVPTSRQGFASETDKSAALDRMFEQASELPERLEQTDLFTLDSLELARHGVVAFAPAYTLWADNAKKIRMLRVPRGQSIRFDQQTQSFSLPPNTRFYKTFLKKVIDREGNERYRKMETRLILARPDDESKDGPERVTALFGTYAWNEQETEAVLVRDPLRNGQPFRDRLVTYYLDEQRAEELLASGATGIDRTLEQEGKSRKYAIPGSERCIHCHMGAPARSFVLGFTPLQIHRRPMGEGGVTEPSDEHELDQLERLIEYGVITDIESADEVVLLEDSQGDRKPRNEHELNAQGHMMGNCAHCHNPRGFPSWVASELRDVLDFMPSAAQGGIFEFPLERFSPRIFRGTDQDFPVPYITPSLFDRPAYAKVRECEAELPGPELAPWRSLIYRNVDAPFSYDDDSAIFPHMPRDIPGFDCRAKQLLGTWMVSIPARLKSEIQVKPELDPTKQTWRDLFPESYDDTPQPYVEVLNSDPNYRREARIAAKRAEEFQKVGRYQSCPDPAFDVVDPEVQRGGRTVPVPKGGVADENQCIVASDSIVPERAHWFVADLTEPAAAWGPRRSDWRDILADGKIPRDTDTPIVPLKARYLQDRKTVYLLTGNDPWRSLPATNRDIRITDALREFALSDFPMGLWVDKPECDFSGVAKVGDEAFPAESRPRWMQGHELDPSGFPPAAPGAPVYSIAPGAQVFTSICSNCHGPLADSRGRMADTIADQTGGDTRVANLRDGIFGPISSPGSNRQAVFRISGAGPNPPQPDDWAARYLLWMGLGGTQRVIPEAILNLVGVTSVMGVKRKGLSGLKDVGANMLAVAEFLCRHVGLIRDARGRDDDLHFDVAKGAIHHDKLFDGNPNSTPAVPLFYRNGDAELWERLCTLNNPAPVRAVTVGAVLDEQATVVGHELRIAAVAQKPLLHDRAKYPPDRPVGDHRGQIRNGIEADNLTPWCLLRPDTEEKRAQMLALYQDARPGDPSEVPYCPERIVADASSRFVDDFEGAWASRGAMNAGLAVFAYLDALAKGEVQRPVAYDRCEDLK